MFEHVDWDTTIISTITSAVVAISVGLYVRYKTKPKSEIIYNANRQANLNLIFSGLNHLNFEFGTLYESIEQRLGELTKKRSEVIPSLVFKPKEQWIENDPDQLDFVKITKMTSVFDEIKPMLRSTLARMHQQHRNFLQDYHIYLNYLHDSFLRDVNSYYLTTTYYSELLLNGENHYEIGIKRKSEADNIMEYVEKDRTVDKTLGAINEFILNWKGWKPKESEDTKIEGSS